MTAADVVEKWERIRLRHEHHHPQVINTNLVHEQSLETGDRVADLFAEVMGSWKFIIIQSGMLMIWIALNLIAWMRHWDPYPFILLNLALSLEAAYAAPIIMMSQNRQAEKDRIMAEEDYRVNTKAEEELKAIMHHLEQQDDVMIDILRNLEEQHRTLISKIGFRVPNPPT